MHARPLPVQIKVHFEKLKFLNVAYDMGFFFFIMLLTLSKWQRFFRLFKLFL